MEGTSAPAPAPSTLQRVQGWLKQEQQVKAETYSRLGQQTSNNGLGHTGAQTLFELPGYYRKEMCPSPEGSTSTGAVWGTVGQGAVDIPTIIK